MNTKKTSHSLAVWAGIPSFLLIATFMASTPMAHAELPPSVGDR